MSYKGMDSLKAAVDAIVANMDKISASNDIDEINDLEKLTAAKFQEVHGHVMAAAWDLKNAVVTRRGELKKKEDEELAKKAGL